jgi:hypothetical protein
MYRFSIQLNHPHRLKKKILFPFIVKMVTKKTNLPVVKQSYFQTPGNLGVKPHSVYTNTIKKIQTK